MQNERATCIINKFLISARVFLFSKLSLSFTLDNIVKNVSLKNMVWQIITFIVFSYLIKDYTLSRFRSLVRFKFIFVSCYCWNPRIMKMIFLQINNPEIKILATWISSSNILYIRILLGISGFLINLFPGKCSSKFLSFEYLHFPWILMI